MNDIQRQDKERALAQEALDLKIEDLKNQAREAGDRTSELMATKFRKDVEMRHAHKCMVAWQTDLRIVQEQKKKQQELDAMKANFDSKGDETLRKLGDQFLAKRERAKTNKVFIAWSRDVATDIENRKKKEDHDRKKLNLMCSERPTANKNSTMTSRQS